ncbi:MAG: hypothetical protein HQL15_06680 [Candidatus Omnitrophica bacterium]|nr:hypothetical protein [Candidatus Omnitrophota bacterium]
MENISFGIMEYLKVFFRRKWFLIVPVFFGLVFGISISNLLPRQFLSTTKILVEEGKNDNPLLNNIAVSTAAAQRIQTIKETMLGWDSLNELVKRLRLDTKVNSQTEKEQLIKTLQNEIKFNPISQNIIEISYVAPKAIQTQAIVENLTDIFIQRNVSAQNLETSNAIKFIEEQLHVYLGKIKSSEIADLKDKLNNLLIDSTEQHPQVRELRAQIDKRMQELKKANLEYYEDAKLSAETTNPMVSQIQDALSKIGQKAVSEISTNSSTAAVNEKDLYKVMLMDKVDNVMARDVGVNETIYNNLLQHLETAKITQRLQSSKEGTKYTIIEKARVPTRPFSPNKILITFIGLFLGLGIGVTLIFLTEFLDKSFLDVNEATSYLGVPLLGAISKINTVESIEENKQRQIQLLFWMTSAGVLMIAITIMFSSLRGL